MESKKEFVRIVRRLRRAGLLLSPASLLAALPAAAAMNQSVQDVLRYEIVLALFVAALIAVPGVFAGLKNVADLCVAIVQVQNPQLTRRALEEILRNHLERRR